MKFLDICLTHQELENSYCKNKIVVIIDVLRASSTTNTLLYNKVKYVNYSAMVLDQKIGKEVSKVVDKNTKLIILKTMDTLLWQKD